MIKYWLHVYVCFPSLQLFNKKITVKPLNSGHLRALQNLPLIKKCALLGGSLTKIVTFGAKRFVRYASYVRYLGCPLLGGFTASTKHAFGSRLLNMNVNTRVTRN